MIRSASSLFLAAGAALALAAGGVSAKSARHDITIANSHDKSSAQVVGSGHVGHQERRLPAFRTLALDVPIDLVVKQGAESRLVLSGDDNLLDLIDTDLDGDTLSIRTEGHFRTRHTFTGVLTVPSLDALSINAAGDVRIENWRAAALALAITGAGDVDLDGSVDDLDIRITGAGDVDLESARLRRASVVIRGTGSVAMDSIERLDAQVAGTGNVQAGDVGELSAAISGMGHIGYRSVRHVARREVRGTGSIGSR